LNIILRLGHVTLGSNDALVTCHLGQASYSHSVFTNYLWWKIYGFVLFFVHYNSFGEMAFCFGKPLDTVNVGHK